MSKRFRRTQKTTQAQAVEIKREIVCEQMGAQVVAEVVMDAEPQGQETRGTESVVAQVVMDGNAEPSEEDVPPEEIVILHHTLVQGGALPARVPSASSRRSPERLRRRQPGNRTGWRDPGTLKQQSGCTTARRGSTRSNWSCNRLLRSSSGQQVRDREGSGRGWRSPQGKIPTARQSGRDGCTFWQTWCATCPLVWGRSWRRNRAT